MYVPRETIEAVLSNYNIKTMKDAWFWYLQAKENSYEKQALWSIYVDLRDHEESGAKLKWTHYH